MSPTDGVGSPGGRSSIVKPSPVLILALSVVGVGVGLLFVRAAGTNAQSVDTLTITPCRVDQSLYQVQIAQQLGATGATISGEARGLCTSGIPVITGGRSVVGTDNLGLQRRRQGYVAGGYAGIQFRPILPIGNASGQGSGRPACSTT
jgi:hypothetical protein